MSLRFHIFTFVENVLMIKYFMVFSFLYCLIIGCNGNQGEYPKVKNGITWIDVEMANSIENPEEKFFIVDVYTNWCGWCKVMDQKTFTDDAVIRYMDEHFHSVKFNAEQKETITFDNKRYTWIKTGRGGVNKLAQEWLGNKLSYPSYVFLNKNKKPIKVSRGYIPSEKFLEELKTIVDFNRK